MTQSTAAGVAAALLLFPLLGSALNAAFGRSLGRRFVNIVGPGSILIAALVLFYALFEILGAPESARSASATLWQWLDLGKGNLTIGMDVTIDQLSIIMLLVITGVGFLIHLYSVGYMEHDPGVARFFSYMNFFIFSMEVLVLAANLIMLIVGWALVALSSYLLIGFWYQRPSAVLAARKAFVTQVIGDVALVIGAFLIFINLTDAQGNHLYTLNLPTMFSHAQSLGQGSALITTICILLAIGAFAKSAQFPLHTWLPDAMEGPTPVSALIHAATMVTAGVYLIARFHPFFDLAPIAAGMVAWVGMGTAVMSGVIALSQIDIKRVIAYSTMSQIGLMIFAVGIGAYGAGMYHFVTHAIFKALLFMAAGNVIHALHDEQDIRLMGGLAPRMKWTYFSFLSGSLALSGVLFAGMFSKEQILGFGAIQGSAAPVLYFVGLLVNILTSVYAFRLLAIVFHGAPQTARGFAAHEAPPVMLIPVVLLGIGAAVIGWVLQWPIHLGPQFFSDFLAPVFACGGCGVAAAPVPGLGVELAALAGGIIASLFGLGLVWRIYYVRAVDPAAIFGRPGLRVLALLSYHKFYFDELYDAILVNPVKSLARNARRVVEPNVMDGWIKGIVTVVSDFSFDTRRLQTGKLRDYATFMISAITFAVVLTIFVTSVAR